MSDDKPKEWRASWKPRKEKGQRAYKQEQANVVTENKRKMSDKPTFIARVFTEVEREFILDCVFDGVEVSHIVKEMGLNKRQFNACRKLDVEFDAVLKQSELDACFFHVNDLLNAHIICADNHKLAAIFSNNRMKLLAANMPEKYGTKIDLHLNQNVSIRIALEGANDRITKIVSGVTTPQLNTPQI